jgi:CRISPR-associated protein Csy3
MLSDFFIGKNGSQYLMLDVNIYAKIGCGQTVYPSQEFVGGSKSKDKDSKGKVLYSVNDVAALHSQKIGNAIRTIDTWYPECDELDIGPISVESYGSMTTISKAFRDPESKKDFFTLFDKFALGQKIETEDELYVMAMLIRGGLFGKKKKGEE